jgi:hypothetical protein
VRRHFPNDPETAHFADLPGYTPPYPQIARLPVPEIKGFKASETDILEESRNRPTTCRAYEVKTLVFDPSATA